MKLKYKDVIDNNDKSWTKIQSNWLYSDGRNITLYFDPDLDYIHDRGELLDLHSGNYVDQHCMFRDVWFDMVYRTIGINITSQKQLDKKAKQLIKVLYMIDCLINRRE